MTAAPIPSATSTTATKVNAENPDQSLLKIWLHKHNFDAGLYAKLASLGYGFQDLLPLITLLVPFLTIDWAAFDATTTMDAFVSALKRLRLEPRVNSRYLNTYSNSAGASRMAPAPAPAPAPIPNMAPPPPYLLNMAPAPAPAPLPPGMGAPPPLPGLPGMPRCAPIPGGGAAPSPMPAPLPGGCAAPMPGCASMPMSGAPAAAPLPSSSQRLGFQTGGEQGIVAFRKNIMASRLPAEHSITYEGIFSDYYFDTESGQRGEEISDDDNDNDHEDDDTKEDVAGIESAETKSGTKSESESEPELADAAATTVTDSKSNEMGLFYPSYCYARCAIPDALRLANGEKPIHDEDMLEDDTTTTAITTTEDDNNGHNGSQSKRTESTSKYYQDPIFEHYLTVGLNSNMTQSYFEAIRKKLNVVIVLDISGSMQSPFDYNRYSTSKMQVANQCVLAVASHLGHNERFGVVLFDDRVQTLLECRYIRDINMCQFARILECRPRGGTNFEIGYRAGIAMFEKIFAAEEHNDNHNNNAGGTDTDPQSQSEAKNDNEDEDEGAAELVYDNRLIFLTDACPNAGQTNPHSLMSMVQTYATRSTNKIYTTFVGIGLDFNSALIYEISTVRGSNYMAVKSSADFIRKMDTEFDYIVSPMVFDLKLTLKKDTHTEEDSNTNADGDGDGDGSSIGVVIKAVYGSNTINEKSGEIMKINTLFPSPVNADGDTKGGIVLIQLATALTCNLIIECEYEDIYGQTFKNKQAVDMLYNMNEIMNNNKTNDKNTVRDRKMKHGQKQKDKNYFDNNGIRKGILLTQYVLLMKQWIQSQQSGSSTRSLNVSSEYQTIFGSFRKHLNDEMLALSDKSMEQEIEILNKLLGNK